MSLRIRLPPEPSTADEREVLAIEVIEAVGVVRVADLLTKAFEAMITTMEGERAFSEYLAHRNAEGWKP